MDQYERCLKQNKQLSCLWSHLVKKDDMVERTTACVLTPAISGFVLWLLKKAQEQGQKRLYFLARDGYLMYRTAQIYCEKLQLPIECRYLSCSRYSLRIPMFQFDLEEALEYICRGGIDVTMRKVLNRAGLTEKEEIEVLEALNIAYQLNDVVPYAQLTQIRDRLRECSLFCNYMCQHSREAYPALKGYMRQEGLLEEVSSAIVDSGWVGSMQKTLNQILRGMGRETELKGYYWGLYELPQGVSRKDYETYYFSPEKGMKQKVYFSNCLFECIFSAPHGMTLKYQQTKTEYVPVYDQISKEREWFMKKTEQYMMKHTHILAEQIEKLDTVDIYGWKKCVQTLFSLFMGNPTKEEAKVYGKLSFSDDVLEYGNQCVAQQMTEEDLKANHVLNKVLVMFGIKKQYIKESAWYEGSAVLYGKKCVYHLWQYRWYKYLLYIRKKIAWRKQNGKS